MAAESAARSWPLIGHRTSIERLRQMAARSRIPPAMLFSGPPSTGRLATARELARTLVCPVACDGVACGECSSCRRVTSKNHPDLDIWSVDRQETGKQTSKSGVLTIETVREIAASAALRPYESERRVIIVDDAETLGEAAQQALLKTLEDAPEHLAIVLIATSADAIIETVQSRVAELTFQLVATAEIATGLRRLRPEVDGPDEIARLAQGKVGWAIDVADKPEMLAEEREASADIESWIVASKGDRLVTAYRSGDALIKKQISPQAVQANLDRATLVWRDLLLNANGAEELAFDPGRVRRLDPTARLETSALYTALAACRQCQFDLSHNVRPRLALEIMVNQWPTLS